VIVVRSINELRDVRAEWQDQGYRVGLVPTMGYFHDGHLSLMEQSVVRADKTVVSLFVNPAQFGPGEDLDVYPRDFDGDCSKAREAGVDLLFCPEATDIYRPGHKTEVSVRTLTEGLCGSNRPGHFTGVATVVTKLFNLVRPNQAFFGEKDFQQLRVIQQLAIDLNLDTDVVGLPIVREPDGLAMSSRNAYLTAAERGEATVLYRSLRLIRERVLSRAAGMASKELLEAGLELISSSPMCSVDYLSIVDEPGLEPQSKVEGRCRVLGALRVNERIRLIDNMALYR
jgi:pantoate--beta-alanine ligase